MFGRSFFDPKIRAGFLRKVGPALTLLFRVAAALSPRETDSKMNLHEGVLRPERVAKQLLLEEEAISKNLFGWGRRGLVTVKNALDYHAH